MIKEISRLTALVETFLKNCTSILDVFSCTLHI